MPRETLEPSEAAARQHAHESTTTRLKVQPQKRKRATPIQLPNLLGLRVGILGLSVVRFGLSQLARLSNEFFVGVRGCKRGLQPSRAWAWGECVSSNPVSYLDAQ